MLDKPALDATIEAAFSLRQPKHYRGRHRARALFGWLLRPRGAAVEPA
jgi:hypothetical protein